MQIIVFDAGAVNVTSKSSPDERADMAVHDVDENGWVEGLYLLFEQDLVAGSSRDWGSYFSK